MRDKMIAEYEHKRRYWDDDMLEPEGETSVYFRHTNRDYVKPETLAAHDKMMDLVCMDLTLVRNMPIWWFVDGTESNHNLESVGGSATSNGFVAQDVGGMFLRADLDPDDIAKTTAHELRHVWQGEHGYDADCGDAEAYAMRMDRQLAPVEPTTVEAEPKAVALRAAWACRAQAARPAW